MIQDIIQIYSSFDIPLIDRTRIPKEAKERIVKNNLARELSEYIIENTDKVPVYFTERIIPETGAEEHRLRINIISDDELRRLRDIEREFNNYNNNIF
jgi:hypothetical protein